MWLTERANGGAVGSHLTVLLVMALRHPPGSLTPRVDAGGWFATTGVESDLMEAARSAVRDMIDHLVDRRGLRRQDSYVLCSLAADLKITEVVDAPNWIVACFMPDAVFVGD